MALAIGFPKRSQLCFSKGMSHVADVIRRAGLLEQQFKALGAQGRGLRERALDLDIRYPQDIFDDLSYISSWRNAVAHFEVDDLPTEEVPRFEAACERITLFMDAHLACHGAPRRRAEARQSKPQEPETQREDEQRQERLLQAALGLNTPQAAQEQQTLEPAGPPHPAERRIALLLAFIGVPIWFAIGYAFIARNDHSFSGGGLVLLIFHGLFCLKMFWRLVFPASPSQQQH